jgi:translation initiation factor 4G
MTRDNFDKLSATLLELMIASVSTYPQLQAVVNVVFEYALAKPSLMSLCANLCCLIHHDQRLMPVSEPILDEAGQPVLQSDGLPKQRQGKFKNILLSKCQEEFETMSEVTAATETATAAAGGSAEAQQAERDRALVKLQRKLSNTKFICELFKQGLMPERIIHQQCLAYLLSDPHERTEEEFEALCQILTSIGKMLDHERAQQHMDRYFQKLTQLAQPEVKCVSSRIRFKLLDVIELRRRRWKAADADDVRPLVPQPPQPPQPQPQPPPQPQPQPQPNRDGACS